MISYIKGTLDAILDTSAVIEQSGIGYEVFISPSTIAKLPGIGREVKIYTYMQVREDGISLYGFMSPEEKKMFNLLIGVSGVGPKSAVGILSALSPEQIMLAVISDDAAALSAAPGVGKKTAQRMILELKDKIKTQDAIISTNTGGGTAPSSGERQDAADALVALGYGRAEAFKAVMETAEEGMRADTIIRLSLKKLSAKG